VQRLKHTAKKGHQACLEKAFAVCKTHGTRQRCLHCRVLWPTAHGKGAFFAMCQDSGHTAKIVTPSAVVPSLFLPSVTFCTRQSFCRVPDKKPTAKKAFADVWLPWGFCRVQTGLCKVTVSRSADLRDCSLKMLVFLKCRLWGHLQHN
jgi:hypothetical protein